MNSLGIQKMELVILLCILLVQLRVLAEDAVAASQTNSAIIEFVQNQVEVKGVNSKRWDKATADPKYNILYPGDQLRTGNNSRAGLRLLGHKTTMILDANSSVLIPTAEYRKSAFGLLMGRLFNFHRGSADEQRFLLPRCRP